jgi:adenylate kinase
MRYDPPPAEIADRLVQRPDDTAEVLVKRLAEYHSKTAPLIPYYDARGVLVRIDGARPLDEVRRQALAAVGRQATVPA